MGVRVMATSQADADDAGNDQDELPEEQAGQSRDQQERDEQGQEGKRGGQNGRADLGGARYGQFFGGSSGILDAASG